MSENKSRMYAKALDLDDNTDTWENKTKRMICALFHRAV